MTNIPQTVAIIGGHGQIAQILTRQLVGRGYSVRSIIRDASQKEHISSLGAEPVVADIESMDARDLAPALKGCDAVVFAAGAGPGSGIRRKRTVDYGGSVLSQQAALEAGALRFVQVSAISVRRPVAYDATDVWKEYVRAKEDADKRLRRTALQWTILRPGLLTDDPGTGRVNAAQLLEHDLAEGASIPREDVASSITACLEDATTIRKEIDLVSGDTPIAEALKQL